MKKGLKKLAHLLLPRKGKYIDIKPVKMGTGKSRVAGKRRVVKGGKSGFYMDFTGK